MDLRLLWTPNHHPFSWHINTSLELQQVKEDNLPPHWGSNPRTSVCEANALALTPQQCKFEDYFMQMLTATALQIVHPFSPILTYSFQHFGRYSNFRHWLLFVENKQSNQEGSNLWNTVTKTWSLLGSKYESGWISTWLFKSNKGFLIKSNFIFQYTLYTSSNVSPIFVSLLKNKISRGLQNMYLFGRWFHCWNKISFRQAIRG